jgi:MFS family permease
MTDIFRASFIVLLLTIGLSAYLLVIGALFSNRVAKAQKSLNLNPGRSFWLGMVNFLFFSLIAFVMLSLAESAGAFIQGILSVPALLILAFLSGMLSLGLTAIVQNLAERLFPEMPNWKRHLWSAIILCLACALPFVGWFLLLPYIAFAGLGATILSFFQKS